MRKRERKTEVCREEESRRESGMSAVMKEGRKGRDRETDIGGRTLEEGKKMECGVMG